MGVTERTLGLAEKNILGVKGGKKRFVVGFFDFMKKTAELL